jgi:DNA-binding beta-propeller fold protein YncE
MKALVTLSILAAIAFLHRADAESYRFLSEIALGGEGGWDYLSIDPDSRRLYVTHGTKIDIVDLNSEKIIGEIADTPGVHGFALAPELGRGFASNGTEGKVSIVDLKTQKTIAKVLTGENPDAILYEPTRGEVYVFNGRGKSATVFEGKSGNILATIPLPGKPEFATTDRERVYVNIEDQSEVVAINAATHAIAATWPLAPGEEPTGMAIDALRHRLFIGCSNRLMVMMDTVEGKVLATVPIGAGVDATAFDPSTRLAFSANGEGNVTIAKEDAPDKLSVLQTLPTRRGARTMALDSTTHKIYLVTAKFEPMPTPSPGAARQRPKIIPGTMVLLVYGAVLSPGE